MTEINVIEVKRKIYYLQSKILALEDKAKMYKELKEALEGILKEERNE